MATTTTTTASTTAATTTMTTSLVELPAAEQESGLFLVESREQYQDIMRFVAQQVAGFTVVATAAPSPSLPDDHPQQSTATVDTDAVAAAGTEATPPTPHTPTTRVPESLGGHTFDELRQSVGIREVELIREANVVESLSASMAQYAKAPPPSADETAASLAFLHELPVVDVTPVLPGDEPHSALLRTSGNATLSSISLADSVELLQSWVVIERPPPAPLEVDESGEWPTRNEPTSTSTTTTSTSMEPALLASVPSTTTTATTAIETVSFFNNWPSFNIASKLRVVVGLATGSAVWGFMTGVDMTTRMIGLLFEDYVVRSGFSYAVILGTLLNPEVVLTAVGSVMIAGVAVGAAAAIPIFVIGSSGVFVSASVYHAYEASRRLVTGDRGTVPSSQTQ